MFLHNDPDDRPASIFGGTTTLVSGPQHPAREREPALRLALTGPGEQAVVVAYDAGLVRPRQSPS